MNPENFEPVSSDQKVHAVTAAELPLSCPMPQMRLWDGHPRIYLPIGKTGYIACPYCNTVYHLVGE
jgi:uncharacterized Zn-finger protein